MFFVPNRGFFTFNSYRSTLFVRTMQKYDIPPPSRWTNVCISFKIVHTSFSNTKDYLGHVKNRRRSHTEVFF